MPFECGVDAPDKSEGDAQCAERLRPPWFGYYWFDGAGVIGMSKGLRADIVPRVYCMSSASSDLLQKAQRFYRHFRLLTTARLLLVNSLQMVIITFSLKRSVRCRTYNR
ncbi:MAG: hypothetical protein ACSLFJ_12985 [Immundisolibacter sp.]|uniref:hypothetical protein n=1 Tax=Immundisolibacter sp. TaxID=1934948 RepID=UPI003EE14E52